MSVSGDAFDEVVIANGVEYNVWRELNTFITWGHMMTEEPIRHAEANVISYRDKRFNLNYENRTISIDSPEDGVVPIILVNILKDVASSAVKNNSFLNGRAS
ncbi:hypothetical protein MNBD_GAMMA12-3379 [hydrothermal vent metagenome]|uniref:Uncharacterized protein n=1 Tax=hydrothermal vent metagenome TaxID=652676 RepID=A0A3B0Y9H7_9ZZZZ